MEVFYFIALIAHSWFRWIVLGTLLFAIYTGIKGRLNKMRFSERHLQIRLIALIACYLQLILGLWLYLNSPAVEMFWAHPKEAMSDKVLRFWSIEHAAAMILALAVITFGYYKSYITKSERKKFTLMAIYYGIGLLIILVSIPWLASSSVARPLFRMPN